MSPYELSAVGGMIDYWSRNGVTGLTRLMRFRQRCPKSVWLNPEPKRIWNAPSVRMIRQIFPMFSLSVDGLSEAVDLLRGARTNRPDVGAGV